MPVHSTLNHSEPKDYAPLLDLADYRTWRLRFLAYLGARRCRHVVEGETEPPAPDPVNVARLESMNQPEVLEDYVKSFEKPARKWTDENAVAYNALLTSVGTNYEAMTVVIENPDVSCFKLLERFDERFDETGQLGPLQAKIAALHSMTIDPVETATRFIGRVTRAHMELARALSDNGSSFASLDIHGVCRLKEGLLHDPRYSQICHVIRGQSEITWKEAVKQITSFEKTQAAAIAAATPAPTPRNSDGQLPPSLNTLRRLVADAVRSSKFKKKPHRPFKKKFSPKHFSKKARSFKCYNCGAYGHRASECKKAKRAPHDKKQDQRKTDERESARWRGPRESSVGETPQAFSFRMFRVVDDGHTSDSDNGPPPLVSDDSSDDEDDYVPPCWRTAQLRAEWLQTLLLRSPEPCAVATSDRVSATRAEEQAVDSDDIPPPLISDDSSSEDDEPYAPPVRTTQLLREERLREEKLRSLRSYSKQDTSIPDRVTSKSRRRTKAKRKYKSANQLKSTTVDTIPGDVKVADVTNVTMSTIAVEVSQESEPVRSVPLPTPPGPLVDCAVHSQQESNMTTLSHVTTSESEAFGASTMCADGSLKSALGDTVDTVVDSVRSDGSELPLSHSELTEMIRLSTFYFGTPLSQIEMMTYPSVCRELLATVTSQHILSNAIPMPTVAVAASPMDDSTVDYQMCPATSPTDRVAVAAPVLETDSDEPPDLVDASDTLKAKTPPIRRIVLRKKTFVIPGYESVDDPTVMIPGRTQHIYNLVYPDTGEPAPRNQYSQEYLDHINQPGNPSPVGYFTRLRTRIIPGNHIPLSDEVSVTNGRKPDDPPPPGCAIPVCDPETELSDPSQDSDGPPSLVSDSSDSEKSYTYINDKCTGSSLQSSVLLTSNDNAPLSPGEPLSTTSARSPSAVAERSPAVVVAKLRMLQKRQPRRHEKSTRHRDRKSNETSPVTPKNSSSYMSCVVDSGASAHVLGDTTVDSVGTSHITRSRAVVQTGKAGADIAAVGTGTVGSLQNVVVVPEKDLREDCVSVPRLDLAGHWTVFGGQRAYLLDSDMNVKATGELNPDLIYRWNLLDVMDTPARLLLGHAVHDIPSLELLHERFGHRNKRDIKEAIEEGLVTGFPDIVLTNAKSGLCPACVKAKSTRQSFKRATENPVIPRRPTVPLEPTILTIVTDLKGPISATGMNDVRYFQVFTDTDTKWREVKFLRRKSDALHNLKELVTVVLASEGLKLLRYHSDGAPELIAGGTKEFLAEHNIRLSYSPPYTPQKNSVAERSNRTVWESAQAMMIASCLPTMLWVFAVRYAVLILNFMPTSTSKGKMTPMQARYGFAPDISHFRKFGCVIFIHIEHSLRDSVGEKASQGYFLGFEWPLMDRVICFVPETGKIVVSAHVTFDEITKIVRKQPIMLQECKPKDKLDFYYLIGLIYRDDENGTLYTTTNIHVQNGYVVATRAPILDGHKGPEESRPVHARNVELMLNDYLQTSCMQAWCVSTNKIIDVCTTLQGAPVGNTGNNQTNHLMETCTDSTVSGSLEPTPCEPASEGSAVVPISVDLSGLSNGRNPKRARSPSFTAHSNNTSTRSVASLPPAVTNSVSNFIAHSESLRPRRNAPRQLTNVSRLGNITDQEQQLAILQVPDMNAHMTRLLRMVAHTNLVGDEVEEELPTPTLPEVEDLTDTYWERRNQIDARNERSVDSVVTLPAPLSETPDEPPIQVSKLAYLSAKEMEEVDEADDSHPVWLDAKVDEIRSQIIEHDAWDVTHLPPDRVPITARWVLKRKEVPVPKLKARFTIRGFQQKEGEDYGETFAPVAKLITLRVFLSLVAILQLCTYQLDLKTAFLNAPLEEEVYCKPTKDIPFVMLKLKKTLYRSKNPWLTKIGKMIDILGEGGVLLLKRAVYGLKQAPRAWWLMFQNFLLSLGFKSNETDPCLYVLHE